MPAAASSRDDTPEFRSPKRALALSFRLSRDRWKAKATQRRQQIKALQIRVRDLEASRDLWKDKALDFQRQLQEFVGLVPSQPAENLDSAVLALPTQPSLPSAADVVSSKMPAAACTSGPDQSPLVEVATGGCLEQSPLTVAAQTATPEQSPSTPVAQTTAAAESAVPAPTATADPVAKKKRPRTRR